MVVGNGKEFWIKMVMGLFITKGQIKIKFLSFKPFNQETFSSQCIKVGKEYNVCGASIRSIYRGKTYKHVVI